MSKLLYTWHEDAWQQLRQLRERLPHAILFYGQEGIGKTSFAEQFAQSVLCESPDMDSHACGQCLSCGWFAQYGHPDFRRIRPEILDEEGVNDEESEEVTDAKKSSKSTKATKAPSKDIKIDQIRALAEFMNISTHRQGLRVIVLYPAEALNSASANALLKTLEEPPPNTLFLLVSHNIDRLLPTILSRCRKLALPMPSQQQSLTWLQSQGVKNAEDWLSEFGGAPLAALAMSQMESRELMDDFLRQLAHPSIETALQAAERLQKVPVVDIVTCLQRWLYDVFSSKLSGTIRYYPRYKKELFSLAQRVDTSKLLNIIKATNDRRAIAEHPLSAKLFTEDMMLDYSALFS